MIDRTTDRIPRITRCKLCAHYRPARFGMMCALHFHAVESPHDGCTWGEEAPDEGEIPK